MASTNDPAETTPPADPVAPATPANDVNAMMLKMADQQQMITQLNEQLETKNQDVKKLSEKSRAEMKNLYSTVIEKWVRPPPPATHTSASKH
jgi:uncharacterized coiled-coil protein SlyX